MSNKSISQLSAGVAVAATDLFPDVQSVGNGPVKVTALQIGTYVMTGVYDPGFTYNTTAKSLTLGVQQTTRGSVVLANTAAGAWPVTLQSSNSTSAAWTLTLPTTAGTNGQALITDGSGNASWGPAGATISDDTSTNATEYPLFSSVTTGAPSTVYVSSTKFTFNPSTGNLLATAVGASNGIFINATTVSANYTIPTNYNGGSFGPVTVNSGITVTVSAGSVWTII